MSDIRRGFAERPRTAAPSPDAWVRADGLAKGPDPSRAELYAARLTIDVTKTLRARIKIAAFGKGMTVADMMRELLEDRFPENVGDGGGDPGGGPRR